MPSADASNSPGNSGPPEATPVVTCFVLRTREGRDEVLLAQRSQQVRTYRGAWAGISGYVEPGVTPLEQAYTELQEEAGLARGDVELVRAGDPVAFRDETIAQSWVVHPFLFHLLRPDHLRSDWEAEQFCWYPPSEVAALPTVPQLADALAHVYPVEPDGGD
ncbi:MAG TPA: NUDIX pyrophosphatase [Ktedonobacterales bacterium]|nr:NUDIX pyrophosphatase [Ktedonobacterales bacterium]